MAVTLNATGTQQRSISTGIDGEWITIAAGTDTVLLAVMSWVSTPGAISEVKWDYWGTPQNMSELVSATGADGNVVKIFGVVNPTDGTHSFGISWTNSVEWCLDLIAFDGVDQTGGTTTFPGANSATGNSANASVTLSGGLPTNGAAVSITSNLDNAISSVMNTQLMFYTGLGSTEAGSSYSFSTGTLTATYAATVDWVIAAVGVAPVGGAPTGQFARPAADVADGNWLNASSSNTNLYASIDEETAGGAGDSDYIISGAGPDNDTCTVALTPITTPAAGTVTIRIRARFT